MKKKEQRDRSVRSLAAQCDEMWRRRDAPPTTTLPTREKQRTEWWINKRAPRRGAPRRLTYVRARQSLPAAMARTSGSFAPRANVSCSGTRLFRCCSGTCRRWVSRRLRRLYVVAKWWWGMDGDGRGRCALSRSRLTDRYALFLWVLAEVVERFDFRQTAKKPARRHDFINKSTNREQSNSK